MSSPLSIGLIGAGRAGRSLIRALHRAGFPVAAIHSRTAGQAAELAAAVGAVPAESPGAVARAASRVILAVPDDQISSVAEQVAAESGWCPGQVALHTSGVHGAAALAAAARQGAAVGSWHPLQTLADPAGAPDLLQGARFAIEGDPPAVAAAAELTRAVGGTPLCLAPGTKPLYHAGAVIAANGVITLMAAAVQAWQAAGIPAHEALPALLPLLRGAAANLERVGLPHALTGPVERGDAGTVARHLQALSAHPDLRSLYTALTLATVSVAEANGLPPAAAAAIRRLLT